MKTHINVSIDSYIINMVRIHPDINVSQICEKALQIVLELPDTINIDMQFIDLEIQEAKKQKKQIEDKLIELILKKEKVKQTLEEQEKEEDMEQAARRQFYKNTDIVKKLAAGEKVVLATK